MILWMRQYNASGKGPVQFTGFDIGFAPTTAADEYDGLIWIESTSPSVRLPFD